MKVILEDIRWLIKELSTITLKEWLICIIAVISVYAYFLFIY